MTSLMVVQRGPNKRIVVRGSCDKMVYPSKAKAKKKACRGRKKGRLEPYKCYRCGEWHLTTVK